MSKLVKDVHKFSGIEDWGNSLKLLWASDNSRPWGTVYSREKFRRFWDNHNSVDVEVRRQR